MKVTFNNTPEQIKLAQAMGSKDSTKSLPAQQAFAGFISDTIQKVLMQAGTVSMFYKDLPFDEDDNPSLPLDLFYGEGAGAIPVWSQHIAGSLATSEVSGSGDMKLTTYKIDSAVSFLKKYARRSRLDVIAKAIERMINEILVKQERNGWSVILKGLAEASTGGNTHILRSTTAAVFQVDDVSRLITRAKRLNQSYANGTPSNYGFKGITDFIVSPEIMGQIRGFSYNPMNTRVGTTGSTQSNTAVPLPDNVREKIYNDVGASSIFDKGLIELIELGETQKYNVLFQQYAGATGYDGGAAFASATDELVVGIDLSRDGLYRPVAKNSDTGSTVQVLVDDQFVARTDKAGFYTGVEEGRVLTDARMLTGIIV